MATRSRIWARWIGRLSERLVLFRYTVGGYRCLAKNWHSRDGELDLVFRRGHRLVFVEVRARRFGGLVTAAESFDAEKYRRVRRCALLYQHRHNLHQCEPVIHLVTVTWHRGLPSMQMFGIDDSLAS